MYKVLQDFEWKASN